MGAEDVWAAPLRKRKRCEAFRCPIAAVPPTGTWRWSSRSRSPPAPGRWTATPACTSARAAPAGTACQSAHAHAPRLSTGAARSTLMRSAAHVATDTRPQCYRAADNRVREGDATGRLAASSLARILTTGGVRCAQGRRPAPLHLPRPLQRNASPAVTNKQALQERRPALDKNPDCCCLCRSGQPTRVFTGPCWLEP